MTALSAVAPTTSVVYAGTPLSDTGWSNTIVSTEPAAVALAIPIGAVGCGRVTPRPLRFLPVERLVSGVIIANLLRELKVEVRSQKSEVRGEIEAAAFADL